MSGYTPVFSSVFTGTLCGKYPDTAAWMFLLALADKNGVVDMTPQAISALTGMPVDDLVQCIDRFEQPDAYSRSTEEEGRRLVRVDPNRPWGWRVVNHAKYREKARKQAYDSQRTESGRDAERKRVSREVPTSPDASRSQTQTQTQTQTEEGIGERATRAPPAKRLPADFELTEKRREVAKAEKADPEREFAKFRDHWLAASGANARKHDWDAAWRNWCRKAIDMRVNQKTSPTRYVPNPEDFQP